MSTTLSLYSYLEFTDTAGNLRGFPSRGSKTVPQLLTINGKYLQGSGQLATATTATLFSVGGSNLLATCTFIGLWSDQALSVELVGTTTADDSNLSVNAGLSLVTLGGNTRAYNASGSFAGSVEAVTILRIRNESGSTCNYEWIAGN